MRKSVFASILAAILLPAAALADSTQGMIESIDAGANTLMLTDGKTYKLPGEFDYSVIRAGMHVLVFYDTDASGRYVTDIEPVDDTQG